MNSDVLLFMYTEYLEVKKVDYKEADMADAWGRRMVRDMPKMSAPLRVATKFSIWFGTYHWRISGLFLIPAFFLLHLVFDGTYLVGGNKLLSDSKYLIPLYVVGGLAVAFAWVIPPILALAVNSWYYSARKHFLK